MKFQPMSFSVDETNFKQNENKSIDLVRSMRTKLLQEFFFAIQEFRNDEIGNFRFVEN